LNDANACYIHLLRHGATASNLMNPPRLQGRTVDHDLTDEGRRQAERTASYLSKLRLAAVYSSPLRRSVQTAEQIARHRGLTVRISDELMEVDVGLWEGKGWDEIERDDAERYRRFSEDSGRHGYPGGESMAEVLERVAPAFERIAAAHPQSHVAVVAHSVVNRAYVGHLLGLPPGATRIVPQDNCGVNLLRYYGGKMKALTINAVAHLHDP